MQTEVTLLIPCNNLRYLHETLYSLESISQPLLAKMEIILLLNGGVNLSRGFSLALNENVMKSLITLETHETSLASILNFGIKSASGKLIARLDADDRILPGRFELQLAEFRRNKKLICLGGQIQVIDQNSKIVGPHSHRFPTDYPSFKRMVTRHTSIAHSSVIFKREIAEKVGGYSPENNLCEDWGLWLRLSPFGEIYSLNQYIVEHRVHDDQSTSGKKELQQLNVSRMFIDASKSEQLIAFFGKKLLRSAVLFQKIKASKKSWQRIPLLVFFTLSSPIFVFQIFMDKVRSFSVAKENLYPEQDF